MPLATPSQFRPKPRGDLPRVGAGRTERRERKWEYLPHLLRQWGEPIGTRNLADFRVLEQIATTAAATASDKVTFGAGTRDLTRCSASASQFSNRWQRLRAPWSSGRYGC